MKVIAQLRASAAAAGLGTRQVDELARKYAAMPRRVTTEVKR